MFFYQNEKKLIGINKLAVKKKKNVLASRDSKR